MFKLYGVLACLWSCGAVVAAEETLVKGEIVSVGLFKNGLTYVEEEVCLEGPGEYRLETAPSPIHGTFWFDTEAAIEFVTTTRMVEKPISYPTAVSLGEGIAGKSVRVYMKEAGLQTASGIAVGYQDATAQQPPAGVIYGYPGNPSVNSSRYLILKNSQGMVYIAENMIAQVYVTQENTTHMVKQPTVLLKASGAIATGTTVRISYLARGISWAPSYKLDISDEKKCSIEQKAIIHNELMDLKDVEVFLISGFPNIEYEHVNSLMSVGSNWDSFFGQLSNNGGSRSQHMTAGNSLTQAISNNYGGGYGAPRNQGAVAVRNEQSDLHYLPIGKRSLGKNDTLTMRVSKGDALYKRLVEWKIPTNRDEHGRSQKKGNNEQQQGVPWDVIQFENPLKYPMTTGPMMVVADGRVYGQSTSHWINPGAEANVRITKALSVPVKHRETEKERVREETTLWGQRYYKTTIDGEMKVSNTRGVTMNMRIERKVMGEVLSADDEPKIELLSDGAWTVNKQSQLEWTIDLKANESKTIKYSYTVFVRH